MLKLQYFAHLMWRADSFKKTLMLGKIEGRRRRGQQRMRWLDGIPTQWTWIWTNSRMWWRTGKPGILQSTGLQRHDWSDLAAAACNQSYGFSCSLVLMWELDRKEDWVLKNWCFWTVVLVKTLESPLDCKEIKSINPKGNQPWICIGRTDAEALIVWSPDAKSWLIEKDPGAGKDWRQEEKGTTEDEMVGWHHWLDGHKFEQIPSNSEGQGSLACCSLWGHKASDKTVTEEQQQDFNHV